MAYEGLLDPAKLMHVEVLDIRYECFSLSLFLLSFLAVSSCNFPALMLFIGSLAGAVPTGLCWALLWDVDNEQSRRPDAMRCDAMR